MNSTLRPGARLGRYEVKSQLGAGGMGEVYRARDEKLNRDVVLASGCGWTAWTRLACGSS